ncbi:SpoIIE family protein phosphatase [Catenuloplanes atrovinosus]|uniref:PAS domain S-box-containing protein n=1 Tax=Catenuloplanes atrovinosus TaxID=137266 RepID=A0AAE4CCD9_9ACTN|nr:SpoIIE family protein phosphatase [Catenuloplanes atrovinosus]MDR7276435.1 PAS domain S-box-containing protein [Catenuloplanes atrovinosus]
MPDGADLSRLAGDPEVVQRVFEQVPLLLCALDGPELRFVAASGAWRSYAGRQDVIGRPFDEMFPEVLRQGVREIFTRVLDTGEPETFREWRIQINLPDSGGTMEMFVDCDVWPRRGPDGAVVGITTRVTDSTERVRERQAAQRRTDEAERRYARARDVIDALQRELLPAGLPVLPRLQIAASYLLADAEVAAGGDWFDAVVLPDGRTALVVGDVVGHGVAASATMGQLRILLHEHLIATADPRAALTAVDAAAERIPGARAATVCVVLLDPATGAVEYCTAGHPAPLVLTPDERFRYLAPTGAGPLGVGGGFAHATTGTDRLAEGELVLLYTDGILERPGRELARSTVELARVAAGRVFPQDAGPAAERVCTETLEVLTRSTGHSDDITLLAVQRLPAPAALELWVTDDGPGAIATVRHRLADWTDHARIGPHDADALRHAVVELVSNVFDHAFVDSPGPRSCHLTVALTDAGDLQASVADRGRWREPVPTPDRGMGLRLAEGLVDTLRVEHDDAGTVATVTLRASTPARLLTGNDLSGRTSAAPAPQSAPLLVIEQPSAAGPRIRVDGPVDAGTVAELDLHTRVAGVSGTRPLIMDLTGVTHLASAGVAALHQLITLHRAAGTTLRLYAPTGTPADTILSLVQSPHDTRDPDAPPG